MGRKTVDRIEVGAWVVAASPASLMSSIIARRSGDDMWFPLGFSPDLHDPTSAPRVPQCVAPYPRAPARRSRQLNDDYVPTVKKLAISGAGALISTTTDSSMASMP